MSEWWSYRPEDMLLFSPRVYWRMFELHNAAIWPLQLVALASGIVMVILATKRPPRGERWIAFMLAVIWLFVGWAFLWHRYATINWAIRYIAPLFALQSLLLLIACVAPQVLLFDRRGIGKWSGSTLAGIALFLYPLLPLTFAANREQAEIFGIAPDPTAIGTLGLLLMARGKLRKFLLPVPIIWCLISGLTLWTMEDPRALLPIAAVALTLAVGVW
ncbi:MAG: DUF6064 family protein [Phyllobacterium sp.]|uniref:DUF6064 family protein n=1 Tax=Phyllobacterium sp. TaxID=1871046 RepID=UPI0030F03D71